MTPIEGNKRHCVGRWSTSSRCSPGFNESIDYIEQPASRSLSRKSDVSMWGHPIDYSGTINICKVSSGVGDENYFVSTGDSCCQLYTEISLSGTKYRYSVPCGIWGNQSSHRMGLVCWWSIYQIINIKSWVFGKVVVIHGSKIWSDNREWVWGFEGNTRSNKILHHVWESQSITSGYTLRLISQEEEGSHGWIQVREWKRIQGHRYINGFR